MHASQKHCSHAASVGTASQSYGSSLPFTVLYIFLTQSFFAQRRLEFAFQPDHILGSTANHPTPFLRFVRGVLLLRRAVRTRTRRQRESERQRRRRRKGCAGMAVQSLRLNRNHLTVPLIFCKIFLYNAPLLCTLCGITKVPPRILQHTLHTCALHVDFGTRPWGWGEGVKLKRCAEYPEPQAYLLRYLTYPTLP